MCERTRSNLAALPALRLNSVLRQIAPAGDAGDAQCDDRQLGQVHRAVLRVAGAQQRLGAVVLGAVLEDLGRAAQHDPAEPAPILVVAVDDESAACGFSRMLRTRFSGRSRRFGFSSIVM